MIRYLVLLAFHFTFGASSAFAQDTVAEPPRDSAFDITATDRNVLTNPKAERERRKRLEERVAAILAGREGLPKDKKPADSETADTSSAK